MGIVGVEGEGGVLLSKLLWKPRALGKLRAAKEAYDGCTRWSMPTSSRHFCLGPRGFRCWVRVLSENCDLSAAIMHFPEHFGRLMEMSA